ncbi:MAG TPA: DmsC/YnfH family molybdoenzyme membrane anchor subunit [Chthoniobacterales bacterium]
MNLVDELLAEQQNMKAAAGTFADWHDSHDTPALEKYYRNLIPLTKPGSGEQYAFQVDLDVCSSCKACVSACHNLNGLDDHETWRDVGLLYGIGTDEPAVQTVTTACHHCADPGCLNGCPVMAYDKDPETGIVRHLDDQCIGCQYCILKCPYDVPKYSKKKGIVRKCDMCHSRLSAGEAPACVQACPNEAIQIVKVTREEIEARAKETRRLVAGAFDSSYTLPSTRYLSNRVDGEKLRPADAYKIHLEHTHWPLVIMLTLTQAAVGMTVVESFHRSFGLGNSWEWLTALAVFHLGLIASILHLGQPLKAWRVFLGLRTSWLSREVIGFGMLPPILLTVSALDWLPMLERFRVFGAGIAAAGAFMGLLCVFCSVMVYADTRRPFWNLPRTAGKFFGSTLVAGLAGSQIFQPSTMAYAILCIALVVKIAGELAFLRHARAGEWSPDKKSALAILGPLRGVLIGRLALAVTGAALCGNVSLTAVGAMCILFGELAERYLFFRAVTAPKMPGGI